MFGQVRDATASRVCNARCRNRAAVWGPQAEGNSLEGMVDLNDLIKQQSWDFIGFIVLFMIARLVNLNRFNQVTLGFLGIQSWFILAKLVNIIWLSFGIIVDLWNYRGVKNHLVGWVLFRFGTHHAQGTCKHGKIGINYPFAISDNKEALPLWLSENWGIAVPLISGYDFIVIGVISQLLVAFRWRHTWSSNCVPVSFRLPFTLTEPLSHTDWTMPHPTPPHPTLCPT